MSEEVRYKILDTKTGYYSKGAIQSMYAQSQHPTQYWVDWNKRGKEWPSLRLLNAHLEKYLTLKGHIPKEWEIIEVHHTPIPMPEWVQDSFLK